MPLGACTCLAQHPGLAHKDQDVGSQDGQAEVQQDDGALRFYEPNRAQLAEAEALVPVQCRVAGHLPSHQTSDLPPEGSIDGKQCEQGHAGHRTADHQGNRGGARQLQGLREMGCWERAVAGHPVSLSGADGHTHVQMGRHSLLFTQVHRPNLATCRCIVILSHP